MLDRRKNQRLPVFLCGLISLPEGQPSLKCLIRNRSDHGALLAVDNSKAIPDEFDLQIPQQALTLRARTRWRGYDHVGVEFAEAKEDGGASSAQPAGQFKRIG